MKKNEELIHVTTRIYIENILSERSPTEKTTQVGLMVVCFKSMKVLKRRQSLSNCSKKKKKTKTKNKKLDQDGKSHIHRVEAAGES